jgi:CheY-like chemotaxis protein
MELPTATRPYSVLFVDDDANVLKALKRSVRPHFRRIHTALSGEEALTILATHPVDVLVSDFWMTSMNGIELMRMAKKSNPGIGSVMLSGKIDASSFRQAKKEGIVSAYVSKPWDGDELIRVIQQVFDGQVQV